MEKCIIVLLKLELLSVEQKLEDRFMQCDDINYYKGIGVRLRDFMRGAYDGRN